MSTIYLPVKAFGDFTISAAILKKNSIQKIPILLPDYLKDLYNVLDGNEFFKITGNLHLDRYSTFFQLRKVKNFRDLAGLIKDVKIIKKGLDKKNFYLLDYENKRSKLLGKNLFYPNPHDNIYIAKSKLFSEHFNISIDLFHANKQRIPVKKIALFPGSRFASKALNDALVTALSSELIRQNFEVKIMYHKSETTHLKGVSYFTNFHELKNLIMNANVIISADSLPMHIAYFLDKFHFVVYNNIENYKWTTPLSSYYNAVAVYKNSPEEVINKILSFISKVNLSFNSSLVDLQAKI